MSLLLILVCVLAPPDPPTGITVKDHSPTTVTFTLTAPQEDGGMPVTGFRVMYEDHSADARVGR